MPFGVLAPTGLDARLPRSSEYLMSPARSMPASAGGGSISNAQTAR